MIVDLDSPASTPDRSGRGGDHVVPYPVPAGLLDEIAASLEETAAGSVELVGGDHLSREVLVGWQVGVLVRLLPHGIQTVRGVDDHVVRRVRAVLRLTEDAR